MSEQVRMHFIAQKSDSRPRTQMMSFLITTPNGKVIAIDGGNKQDTEYFHGYMEALLGGKPHIDFWFLTHPHDDHTDLQFPAFRISGSVRKKLCTHGFGTGGADSSAAGKRYGNLCCRDR